MAKQATQIQKSFDPKKISLRDLVELYIKESAFKNDSATANKIRQTFNRDFLDGNTKKIKNQLKPFLDRPVSDLFDTAFEGTNPMIEMFDKAIELDVDKKASARSQFFIDLNSMETNVKRMMTRLYPDEEFVPLTETVVKPKAGVKYGRRYSVDTEKIGEFKYKAIQAAIKDPTKEGVARMAMFLLDTGFRPSMAINAPFTAYVEPKKTFTDASNVSGIYLDANVQGVKMGNEVNIPLSKGANSNVQGAMEYSLNHLSGGKTANGLFVNADGSKITLKQLGDFVKSIDVPGIMKDREELVNDRPKLLNNLTRGGSIFRMFNATAYRNIGVAEGPAGQVKGRITKQDPSEEKRYRSAVEGAFDASDVQTTAKLDHYYWMQQTGILQRMGILEQGQALNPNVDLFTLLKEGEEELKGAKSGSNLTMAGTINPSYIIEVDVNEKGHFIPKDPQWNTAESVNTKQIFPSMLPAELLTPQEPTVPEPNDIAPEYDGDPDKLSNSGKGFFNLLSKNKNMIIGTGVSGTVATIAKKGTAAVSSLAPGIGAVEIPKTMKKIEEMGGGKGLQKIGALSEVAGPVAFSDVMSVVEPVAESVVKSAEKAEDETKEKASSLISKALTGGLPLPQLNFNEGGFINKKERADAGQ